MFMRRVMRKINTVAGRAHEIQRIPDEKSVLGGVNDLRILRIGLKSGQKSCQTVRAVAPGMALPRASSTHDAEICLRALLG